MNRSSFLCFLFFLLAVSLVSTSCTSQCMQRQVRNSRTVVLDIGHHMGAPGAATPNGRHGGMMNECSWWYRNVGFVKQEIEKAGYICKVCNRGAAPRDPELAACARRAGVHQVNTPQPGAVYRSRHNPRRMAVGILSADYALDQKPACVVFLHHNSNSEHWQVYTKGGIYCNAVGIPLANALVAELNAKLMNSRIPNGGEPVQPILRDDGRLGGGDWLNTCNDSWVPAAITEAVFLSNPQHATWLAKPRNAELYARTVGRGIVRYLNNRR